ncbi:MAG: class I SAM-dependent methyltransferase [Proteobacteria bacterium]|nr:class I SAM-dependent methyltransferase [Pseudomonadota bacterium]
MAESTIRFEDGAVYEEMMGRWSRPVGDQFLDWLAPDLGLAWVDVGCGNGAFTRRIVANCAPARVDAIDPSPAQIQHAQVHAAAPGVAYRQGDAMALPFADGTYDVATMALVLFFVPQPARGVAEMVRVVRPGGTVAAYMWDMYNGGFPWEPLVAELRALGHMPPRPPSVEASRPEVMAALWADAGLDDIEVRGIEVTRTFESFDAWWKIALTSPSTAAVIQQFDANTLAELRSRVRDRLPTDVAGRVTPRARANAIKGQLPG